MEEYQRDVLRNKGKQEDQEKEYRGFVAGYQKGNHQFAELGYCYAASSLGFLLVGASSSAEWNFKDKVGGFKLGLWFNSILSAGLNTVTYYNYNRKAEDFKKFSMGVRPEIGIGFSVFNLTYGYNLLFLHPHLQGVNKHMISGKIVIPVSRIK